MQCVAPRQHTGSAALLCHVSTHPRGVHGGLARVQHRLAALLLRRTRACRVSSTDKKSGRTQASTHRQAPQIWVQLRHGRGGDGDGVRREVEG